MWLEKFTAGPWRVIDTIECHNGWNGPEGKSVINRVIGKVKAR